MKSKKEVYLILDNIRSNFNVGSIFRIADCAGVKKIFLAGTTPAPIDRFGREVGEIKKVALGAEKNIPWEKVSSTFSIIKKLKKACLSGRQENFEIVSLEQSPESIDYKKFKPKKNFALIVGNEVDGVSKKVLDVSDKIIEIKMAAKKESLNVSMATAVALFRILGI